MQATPHHPLLHELGSLQWVRAHMSTFAAGSVLLVCANLLIGGSDVWSLTAIGIWALLLLVHIILLAIARLSVHLMDDADEEEVVLLPIQEAVIVPPVAPSEAWQPPASSSTPSEGEGEKVSWQIATDSAHLAKSDLEQQRDD